MSVPVPSPVGGLDLEARLASLLDFVGESAKDATSFAVEQAPLVAQEIVRWHIAFYAFGALVGFGVAIALALTARHLLRKAARAAYDTEAYVGIGWALAFFASVAVVFSVIQAGTAVKGIVAPRLVVIDEIKSIGGRR